MRRHTALGPAVGLGILTMLLAVSYAIAFMATAQGGFSQSYYEQSEDHATFLVRTWYVDEGDTIRIEPSWHANNHRYRDFIRLSVLDAPDGDALLAGENATIVREVDPFSATQFERPPVQATGDGWPAPFDRAIDLAWTIQRPADMGDDDWNTTLLNFRGFMEDPEYDLTASGPPLRVADEPWMRWQPVVRGALWVTGAATLIVTIRWLRSRDEPSTDLQASVARYLRALRNTIIGTMAALAVTGLTSIFFVWSLADAVPVAPWSGWKQSSVLGAWIVWAALMALLGMVLWRVQRDLRRWTSEAPEA